MAFELFGFKIERNNQETLPSIVRKNDEEGVVEATAAGGAFAAHLNMEGTAKSEYDFIMKYRDMASHPECDLAIENIVQESIVADDNIPPVTIDLSNTKLSKNIKNRIRDEFDVILSKLDFDNQGPEIFRRWYIDGRLYYNIVIDPKDPRRGIVELRPVDPLKIKKVKELDKKSIQNTSKQNFTNAKYNEYYIFSEKGLKSNTTQALRVATDSVSHCHSGLLNETKSMTVSYLHKAIKALNQLRMLEDAVVIYRIARAPERRIFYVDTGNLPKIKAEQYLRDIMTRFKNKLVYDASTGDLKDDRRHMSMLEDYWMPRREGGRGTEISTLPGGQNLGEMEDVNYFRRKLFQSLNVPLSRLEADTPFQLGRASEISRDELKFNRFIRKLRTRFNHLFLDLLEKQLILKNIIDADEWFDLKRDLKFAYASDSQFSELKEAELLQNRVLILRDVEEYIGKYFSVEFVRKNILHQSEEMIEQIDKEIANMRKDNPAMLGYDDELGVSRQDSLNVQGADAIKQQDAEDMGIEYTPAQQPQRNDNE